MKIPFLVLAVVLISISCKKDEADEPKTEETPAPTLLESISGEYTGDVHYYEEHWWLDHVSHCPADKDLWEYGDLAFINPGDVEVMALSEDSLKITDDDYASNYGNVSRSIFMDNSLIHAADNYSVEFKGAENDSLIIERTLIIEGHSENWLDGTVSCVYEIYNSVYRLKRQ